MKNILVIGAGIVGLATARAWATRGHRVTVIERGERAVGASIRNFGMIWPIGQPLGERYERAMLSRSIWKTMCAEANIWSDEVGSLHLAYAEDELAVIEEFVQNEKADRNCTLLTKAQVLRQSPAVVPAHLQGALSSSDEIIVEARVAIAQITACLNQKYQVEFIWNTAVTEIVYPTVKAGARTWQADRIFVCSGADFETLYPDLFREQAITKCKLQMMRLKAPSPNWRLGPALCGGLTLIHYHSFQKTAAYPVLKARFEAEYKPLLDWGIHVMVAQNAAGELTVGDSHEYGLTFDPFDKHFINEYILEYLKNFARFDKVEIAENWHGIYPKMLNGATELVLEPESGVTIVNGLGGNGMTLSFGLAEELFRQEQAILLV